MNPQYAPPQQQFGGPQNLPPNRTSPSLNNPGQFQNVPLGPPKPGYMPPPLSSNAGQFPPSNVGQFPPLNAGQFPLSGSGSRPPSIPSSQLPPNQLPPGQLPPSQGQGFHHTNPFGGSKNAPPPNAMQNGPSFQNDMTSQQQVSKPPTTFGSHPPVSFGAQPSTLITSQPPSRTPPTLPITQSQSAGIPPRPPSNQSGPDALSAASNESSIPGIPPITQNIPSSTPPVKLHDTTTSSENISSNLPDKPPSSGSDRPHSNMPDRPPLNTAGGVPPNGPGGPPSNVFRISSSNLSGGPPSHLQGAAPSNLFGGRPPNLQGAPQSNLQGAPPSNLQGAPPSNLQGGPSSNLQGGPPFNSPGGPQGGPPFNSPGGPQGGPPFNLQGAPPSNLQGAPSSNLQGGPPFNLQGSPPSNLSGGPPPRGNSSNIPASFSSNIPGGPPSGNSGNSSALYGNNVPLSNPANQGYPPSSLPGDLPKPPISRESQPTNAPSGIFPGSGQTNLPGFPSGPAMPGAASNNIPGGPAPPNFQGNFPPVSGPPPVGNILKPPSSGFTSGPPFGTQKMQQPNLSGPMPPPVNQPAPPTANQFPPGPPRPGQPPLQSQPFNRQPMPPLPNQPGSLNQQAPYQQQPGMPPQVGPNQLSNQMQGMNLSGPRQYPTMPGGPTRNAMNGEGGPQMPPPVGNSYANGQQMRGPQGGGYPPMPGQGMPGGPMAGGPGGPMPGGPMPGGYPQANYQQPQQQRRLDPDQMPNPIQVTQDDQQNKSGVFATNQKGLVPPLVTTNFVVQDQGNASPRFIRSSMYNVPISSDIIKQTAVPFSLVISPMARQVDQEYPPPIVNFGELGPVRCIRCKAYMCPYMQFIDAGRRFQCLFCKATTDVPTEYFQHLDHTGQRMDRYERPELVLGTYEFVATADYCRNNTLPKPPAIIFVIDVSYNNIKSGLVHLLCSQMKEIIQNLPIDQGQEKSNMKVGFITYNSSVHFYNIKGTLAAPQMLVVGDTQEMFMPLLDGFLCTPEESGPVIDALMQQIPVMFGDTRETEIVLLPAIQAGLEALKASECTGKLLVFHSTLPIAEAPGKLKNREDRKMLGTDKEKTVLTPQTQAYNQLGQDCVAVGCSVDLFIFNNSYIDLATIGQVARLTGGEIFKYTYFQADIDGDRLVNDVINDISRPIAFDAIMRVRTSQGVRPTDFYGHFFMSNTTDMELAAIDCDKAVALEVKHDDKLSEDEGVYIQAALLYTSCSGQRRLRIINLSLKTCSQMADLYRSCELDTLINYLSKQAVYKLLDNNPKAVKDSIVTRAAQILATYRKNCASPSSAGQLILPECMKLLPLYVNCLLKSDALSGGSDMSIDDRSFVMQAVMIMDVATSVNYFYPRLISIHDMEVGKDTAIPPPIRCSVEKMNEQGIYILENGIHMFLWFGLGVNPDLIQKLFGAPSAIQVDIDRVSLPELDNAFSLAVRSLIEEIRIQRHRQMRLTIVRQREKLEPVFKHFLVEDRGTDGSPSYVDFLCHMHKEIRTLLS